MSKRTGIVTLGGDAVTLIGDEVKVGDQAKPFTVVDKENQPVSLGDAKGKKVIISVVPSIDTSICAAQTRRFNEEAANLENVVVYTISVDLPFALERFCAAEGIDAVKTLSDHKELNFGLAYGFVIEEARLLARGIVVLDENHTVKYVEYVPEVASHPDYDKALEVVKGL